MAEAVGYEEISAARILRQTWQLGRDNISRAVMALAAMSIGGGMSDAGFGGSGMTFLATVLSLLVQFWLVRSLLDDLGLRFATGPRFAAFFGQGILVGIALLLGFLFLIVPAIILCVRWSISAPAVIAEDQSITAAMSESWRRTQGHFWAILIAFAVVYAPTLVGAILGTLFFEQGLAGIAIFELLLNSGLIAGWHMAVALYAALGEHRNISEVFA